jgi:hypothetical protein
MLEEYRRGDSLFTICSLFFRGTLKNSEANCRKKLLPGHFAILMPAMVQLSMTNVFIYLALPHRVLEGLKNPKYWEQSINHNRAEAAAEASFILGFLLRSPLASLPFAAFAGIKKSPKCQKESIAIRFTTSFVFAPTPTKAS